MEAVPAHDSDRPVGLLARRRRELIPLLLGLATACGGSDGQGGPVSTLGSLRINVTTTGSPLDPDGYRVAFVEGDTLPSAPIGISDTVVYDSVQPGIFRVRLDSIACRRMSPTSRA